MKNPIRSIFLLLFSIFCAFPANAFTSVEVTQDALSNTDWLLERFGDRQVDLNRPSGVYWYSGALLNIRWVRHDELIRRKELLEQWLKNRSGSFGSEFSESKSELTIWNTGEAVYSLAGSDLTHIQNATTVERMWRVLLSVAQTQEFYDLILNKLPVSETAKQSLSDSSICLIIQYARDSRLWEKHYYLPDVTYANGILSELVVQGTPVSRYLEHKSDALAPQDWTVNKRLFVPTSKDDN